MDSANAMLTCELELIAISNGEVGLVFKVSSPGQQPVTVNYFEPFIDFDLSVWSGEEPVRVSQPAYDAPAEPQTVTIAPGETVQIDTPINLRFAEAGGSPVASEPTVWTLEHEPAPVRLRVLLRLEGADVAACTALYDPTQPGEGSMSLPPSTCAPSLG